MEDELKKLIKENTKLTKHIHTLLEEVNNTTKKIRRFTIISEIMSLIKMVIIMIPVIIGILYLPPILKKYISEYQEIFGLGTSAGGGSSDVLQNALIKMVNGLDAKNNVNELPPELLKILNNK
ncbi:hypothetical protein ISS03_02575 [Patescibacteria group bacterium]|nr:hypothetical protein [Patescibacteria group bacterium]